MVDDLKKRKFLDSLHKATRSWIVKTSSAVLVLIIVFIFGVNVGNGRIVFGTSSPSAGLPSSLNFASVNEVYQALKQNYDGKLTTQQLLDGLKEGLAQATGDPYTEYFNATEAKAFTSELNNSFSGIGAELGQDASGNLEIIAPINGSPAAKAGLQPKDVISEINGQTTSGLSPDAAVDKIRGPSGSQVTLSIIRGGSQTLSFTITRSDIQLPSVTSKILSGNIGYMQISTFADDTATLAQKAAATFKSANVKGIILDLRDNPGGLVDAAVHVSSLWLPQGTTIMNDKRGSVVVDTYSASGGNVLNGIPTVVLVNDGSASAAEITAGALHDNKAATIMGTKTYGKGVVQAIIDLSGGAELKVTIASWYRPNGQNINKQGITPDKIVQLTGSGAQQGSDTQEDAAINYLLGKS